MIPTYNLLYNYSYTKHSIFTVYDCGCCHDVQRLQSPIGSLMLKGRLQKFMETHICAMGHSWLN